MTLYVGAVIVPSGFTCVPMASAILFNWETLTASLSLAPFFTLPTVVGVVVCGSVGFNAAMVTSPVYGVLSSICLNDTVFTPVPESTVTSRFNNLPSLSI